MAKRVGAPPGKGRFKDEYDDAAERIVFDESGPFRKALLDMDDGELAVALAAEFRELARKWRHGGG